MSSSSPAPLPVPRRFSPSPSRGKDAGLLAGEHYKRRLPAWRYDLRQCLIPIVRWETPYLARIQAAYRTPMRDSYFAFTANLGTHTFFMTFLPICFWCGLAEAGVALVHMLGLGVYLSGALKDLVGLPRPLSPPLQRITMSGSAALEYGFPSTHTTNAVSAAIFAFYHLYISRDAWSPTVFYFLAAACCCYVISIPAGRVYCGMHGFFDVVVGALLGAVIAWARIVYGPTFDVWIISGSWLRPAIVVAVLALAIRFHPEPADNCPCFDDSVAFIGVIMGVELGTWHYVDSDSLLLPRAGRTLAAAYPFTNADLLKSSLRLIGGITVIFLWRALMKPLLLRILPPLFRFIDNYGFAIPRRYFLQAREYTHVPPLRKDDNVIPSAADIPGLLSSFRNPRRRRVSVGPQSEADARELLAQRREQSRREGRPGQQPQQEQSSREGAARRAVQRTQNAISRPSEQLNSASPDSEPDRLAPPPASPSSDGNADGARSDADSNGNRSEDDEIFAALQKPRTHYDVEVVTKLVVYAGIAWWAVEGNPVWFRALGLV